MLTVRRPSVNQSLGPIYYLIFLLWTEDNDDL